MINEPPSQTDELLTAVEKILVHSSVIRYVAICKSGKLFSKSKVSSNSSSSESDQYEEWLVNPTLLTLAIQRGNLDCGGLNFVLVRYGHFFQWVKKIDDGHISICIEPEGNPIALSDNFEKLLVDLRLVKPHYRATDETCE
jgi:hypothetical protein